MKKFCFFRLTRYVERVFIVPPVFHSRVTFSWTWIWGYSTVVGFVLGQMAFCYRNPCKSISTHVSFRRDSIIYRKIPTRSWKDYTCRS